MSKSKELGLELLAAVQIQDTENAIALIESGADVNVKNIKGRTPIQFAALSGQVALVEKLIKEKANINDSDDQGYSALHHAADKGHCEVVEMLIASNAQTGTAIKYTAAPQYEFSDGFNVSDTCYVRGSYKQVYNYGEYTPLYLAAQKGHTKIVAELLAAGADTSNRNRYYIPLFIASRNGHVEIVKKLIAAKSDVNAMDENYDTVLYYGIRSEKEEIVKLLIAAGADVNAINKGRVTPLMFALAHPNIVTILIKSKAITTITDEAGNNVLHCAAQYGYVETIKILLKNCSDLNQENNNKLTPLDLAMRNFHSEVVRILLSAGAKIKPNQIIELPSAPRSLSWRGANFVIEERRNMSERKIIIKLLEQESKDDSSVKSDLKHEEYGLSEQSDNKMIELSLNLFKAISSKNDIRLSDLIKEGVDVNIPDENGNTPLVSAINQNCPKAVQLLLKAGAKFNYPIRNSAKPLYYAADKGNAEIIQLLINAGAKIDNDQEIPPLYVAAEKGHAKAVTTLLAGGAKVNVMHPNPDNGTSLHIAAFNGHVDVVIELLKAHADINAKTKQGYNAVERAKHRGNAEVERIIDNFSKYGRYLSITPKASVKPIVIASSTVTTKPVSSQKPATIGANLPSKQHQQNVVDLKEQTKPQSLDSENKLKKAEEKRKIEEAKVRQKELEIEEMRLKVELARLENEKSKREKEDKHRKEKKSRSRHKDKREHSFSVSLAHLQPDDIMMPGGSGASSLVVMPKGQSFAARVGGHQPFNDSSFVKKHGESINQKGADSSLDI